MWSNVCSYIGLAGGAVASLAALGGANKLWYDAAVRVQEYAKEFPTISYLDDGCVTQACRDLTNSIFYRNVGGMVLIVLFAASSIAVTYGISKKIEAMPREYQPLATQEPPEL